MPTPTRRTLFLAGLLMIVVTASVYFAFFHFQSNGNADNRTAVDDAIPFNGERAYGYLKEICDIGPRTSGSAGMASQQKLLQDHFSRLGGVVAMQEFDVRHPEDGSRVTMKNLIVQWHPDRAERILICAHYDTRPFPDQDRYRKRGRFIGANDGASGVALLCELGTHMPKFDSRYGIDFVLFDGEEFIFDSRRDRDFYFQGSTYFSRSYVAEPPRHKYVAGVLLDMVGDAELQLYYEKNSLKYAGSLTRDIWNTARRLGVREFIARSRTDVRDDHLPLNEIAKIPTCDIIDFDYPRPGGRQQYWHTEEDTPDKCSADSLAKVGWVLLEWLKALE